MAILKKLDPVVKAELQEKWIVLFIAMVMVITAFSLPAFAPQNIYDMLERDFGWSRTEITALATFKYATGAFVAIVVGALIDRVGVKAMLIFVSVAGAVAMSSFLVIPNLAAYWSVGILFGIATTGSIVCLKVLIGRSFDYAAGFAMGVTLMGMSVGQILVPYLIVFMMPEDVPFSWRSGMFQMSLGIWLVAIPALIFGLRENQLKDSKQKKSVGGEANLGYWDLFKEPRFWMIAVAVFLAGLVDQAFIQNVRFILVTDAGIDNLTFANVILVYGIAGMISRPLLGVLIDWISVRGIAFAYLFLGASALLTIPLAASGPLIIYLWASLRGIAHSGVMLDSALLAKHCYGRHNLGLLIGVLTGIINVGFAIGPVGMAYIYDISGSYTPAFILYAILGFIAVGIVLGVRPTYWLAAQEERRALLAQQEATGKSAS